MGIYFSRVIWCSRNLWYMTGIYHDLYWYITRILSVLIHWGFVINEIMKLPPQVRTSMHRCIRRQGTARDPFQSMFYWAFIYSGICQVYTCHIFQLDASESASAARRFRACLVSQARQYVSDLDFLRIISVLWPKGHQLEAWTCQSYPPIQILFKIHTLAVIGVQVIALSVWKGDDSVFYTYTSRKHWR